MPTKRRSNNNEKYFKDIQGKFNKISDKEANALLNLIDDMNVEEKQVELQRQANATMGRAIQRKKDKIYNIVEGLKKRKSRRGKPK